MGNGASTAVYRDATSPELSIGATRGHLARQMEIYSARSEEAASPRVHVVIDGMNVAMSNVPSYEHDEEVKRGLALRGLQLAIEFFTVSSIPFKIFAPRGWVESQPELFELVRAKLLFVTPGGLDDNFMIAHADNHGSFIVSNDRFIDHVKDRGYDRRWLDYHRVAYMFDPAFAPDPDAVERMRNVHEGQPWPAFAAPKKARRRLEDEDIVTPSTTPSQEQATLTKNPTRPDEAAAAEGTASPGLLRPLNGVSRADKASSSTAPLKMQVPKSAAGLIIGKRGAQIQAIELETGCKIDVEKRPPEDEAETIDVTLRGPPEAQQAAAKAIEAILESRRRPYDHTRRQQQQQPENHNHTREKPRAASSSSSDEAMDVSP